VKYGLWLPEHALEPELREGGGNGDDLQARKKWM